MLNVEVRLTLLDGSYDNFKRHKGISKFKMIKVLNC